MEQGKYKGLLAYWVGVDRGRRKEGAVNRCGGRAYCLGREGWWGGRKLIR